MKPELTTIHLVGSLGKAMGRSEWKLDVKSPAEAIRAININTRGKLKDYLTGQARDKLYRVALQRKTNDIDIKDLKNRSGRSTIYIIPTMKGRNSGIGKVIAGAILVIVGVVIDVFTEFSGGNYFISAGISMILGGAVQLLTPTSQSPAQQQQQAQSTLFPGNNGAVTQGGCIPVVYGHAFVSPIPISITIGNNDVSTSSAGTIGDVDSTSLDGGGTQYAPH